jgi:hypothetical protein
VISLADVRTVVGFGSGLHLLNSAGVSDVRKNQTQKIGYGDRTLRSAL